MQGAADLIARLLVCRIPGKDCPSDSSQFSHPDVVIGLTVLAYRYEGMRRHDFIKLMVRLFCRRLTTPMPTALT